MKKSTVVAAAVFGCILSVQGAGAPAAKEFDSVFRPEAARTQQSIKAAGVFNLGYALPGEKNGNPATCTVVNVPGRKEPVMRLVSHGDAKILKGSQFAKFRVIKETTGFNKLKMGMEFQLNDVAEKRPQLQMIAVIGANAKSEGYVACVRFGTDCVGILTPRPNKPASAIVQQFPCAVGAGKFHTFTVQADAASGTVSVFMDGAAKPVAAAKMPQAKGFSPAISFGDGAGDVYGSADIAYFGWKLE